MKSLQAFFSLVYATRVAGVDSPQPYPWRERSSYYYQNWEDKIPQLLNDECLVSYKLVPTDSRSHLPLPENENYVNFISLPVEDSLKQFWKHLPPQKLAVVEPLLCEVVQTKSRPIFDNVGCQLPMYMHPSAPRCQPKYLKYNCEKAQTGFQMEEGDHNNTDWPPLPYAITARDSFVTKCGQLISRCGLVHTDSNCNARSYKSAGKHFQRTCDFPKFPPTLSKETWIGNTQLQDERLPNRDHDLNQNVNTEELLRSYSSGNQGQVKEKLTCKLYESEEEVEMLEKVFVVAQVDDTHVYHEHIELLPRIVAHLEFLVRNPDIKILYGCDQKKESRLTKSGLRHGVQALLPLLAAVGIDARRLIVHRPVFAREVYLPMEGACQDPVYNTWALLRMRGLFLDEVMNKKSVSEAKRSASDKPRMILVKRSANAKATRNGHDSVRQWTDEFAENILLHLRERFPSFDVVLFTDKDEGMMACHLCQVELFASAKVVVGVHGAGLSNMLYMPPNGAVIELCPYGNDGRCLLGGGPFNRLATLLSHSYYVHHPPFQEYKWIVTAKASEFNVSRLLSQVEIFLKRINMIEL